MNDKLFYSIWRNNFIRNLIREKEFQDVEIDVDSSYLKENYKCLSLLSLADKTFIKCVIQNNDQLLDFINNQYNYLVNSLEFINVIPPIRFPNDIKKLTINIEKQLASEVDFQDIPSSVTNLRIIATFPNSFVGQIPISVREFYLKGYHSNLVLSLPTSLTKCEFHIHPSRIDKPINIPSTVKKFDTSVSIDILSKIVFNTPDQSAPKDLNVDDFKADLSKYSQFPLLKLKNLQWLKGLNIFIPFSNTDQITLGLIPSNITKIYIYELYMGNLMPGVFPESLEVLYLAYEKEIQVGILPPSLLEFKLFENDILLKAGILPTSLKRFKNYNYYSNMLTKDLVPPSLKKLSLTHYNRPIDFNLPDSLEILTLVKYNHPFSLPLPKNLKKLCLYYFDQAIGLSTLPNSLENLFLGSEAEWKFPQELKLDNLKKLGINILNQSVCDIMSNVTKVCISFHEISSNLVMLPQSIKKLRLERIGSDGYLYQNLLPKRVEYLTLTRLKIAESGLIPNSCSYLETDQIDFEKGHLPRSIKDIRIKPIVMCDDDRDIFFNRYSGNDIFPTKNINLDKRFITLK
ncbi:hypothetical protein CYY_001588 [Polysphondylium violaceum]|uniref:FNIP repeat-containing protein n=1 Tax=Polysphondylium violaceum TaxID=133409 RepID=A0A8J4Q303_9MYCE|nr:hypothetical protein CYY_001588 [Polysphondylium violaceum]